MYKFKIVIEHSTFELGEKTDSWDSGRPSNVVFAILLKTQESMLCLGVCLSRVGL